MSGAGHQGDLPQPVFRTDVLSFEGLKPGMQLRGVVRNVGDFGAFADIGGRPADWYNLRNG